MKEPERITSPYAPDLGEVRAFLERMIHTLRFVELIAAIIAFVARVCEVNGELSKKLAELRQRRPRSESLERLERQLVLPLGDLGVAPASRPKEPPGREKKSRKGRHPGRAALPVHLPRIEVSNPVPPELRVCPRCGAEMTTVGHARCEILSVIPARVVVEVRLDERVACPNDDTIVSAPTPPAIVERGKLSDALIVEATVDKYLEHTPIERQCTRFARLGVEIAPQTLGRSVAAHIDLLTPIAKLIEDKTRGPGLLGTDATGIPVLDPDTVDGIRTGAMWCWTNARWVSFFYSPSAMWRSLAVSFLVSSACNSDPGLGARMIDAGGGYPNCSPTPPPETWCTNTCGNSRVDNCERPTIHRGGCFLFQSYREACDGPAPLSCTEHGFYGGSATCDAQCEVNTDECNACAPTNLACGAFPPFVPHTASPPAVRESRSPPTTRSPSSTA